AGLIHRLSKRRGGPLVKFNCTAIPAGLLESELFGHERGAFTSAIARRLGRFELANNGTLFLDEIGDLPLDLQPKLLRVLEEQAFERIGSTHTIRTDVRVIAATNRPLEGLVEAGEFRADLFYRLNVFPIDLPPLRERTEDIPPLVRHFVAHHARHVGRRIDAISPDVIDTLVRYPWPGNVRELQHVLHRAVIMSQAGSLELHPGGRRGYPCFFAVGTASLGLGQLSGPAVGGLLADWFGPSAIGFFAAAIYSAGTLAAAADGFFARTLIGSSRADRGRPRG